MGGGVVQISVLVGCAGVAIRMAIQLLVVIWSLRADASGRRHAIELLKALRWDGFKQR
jgi:cell division protein FtsX